MKNHASYNSLDGDEIKLVIHEVDGTKTKKIIHKHHHVHSKDHPDPRCNIFRKENMAITMAYLSVGLVMSLIQTPLNVYMVKVLNAEPPLQNTIAILQTLPWSMKLVFGFVSDSCPIYGMQRKPYLTIGAITYSLAFITYSLCNINNTAFLALCIFIGTLGLIMVDVMADTMCVQRSRFENDDYRGQMQASFYSVRFAGGLVGAIVGAIVCNEEFGFSFHRVAFGIGMIPFLLVVPWLIPLRERFKTSAKVMALLSRRNTEIAPNNNTTTTNNDNTSSVSTELTPLVSPLPGSTVRTKSPDPETGSVSSTDEEPVEDTGPSNTHPVFIQLNDIWETVQLKSVWRPMLFVYTYNLLQVPNVAWQSYLQLTLHFPPWILGLTVILGSFMTLAGVTAYKNYFFKSSWRSIYVGTMCLTTFFSLLQLVLIFQLNITYLHISNYFFALGDDVITAYISGIQFLPVCIMYMRLCPDGAEGASYSMLTTFGNIALVCASNIGNILAGIWDVSNTALKDGNVNGIWKLSLLTSILAMLPILWLRLLPNNAEEQDELAKSKEKSRTAGIIFLIVLFGSLAWTSISAILRVAFNV